MQRAVLETWLLANVLAVRFGNVRARRRLAQLRETIRGLVTLATQRRAEEHLLSTGTTHRTRVACTAWTAWALRQGRGRAHKQLADCVRRLRLLRVIWAIWESRAARAAEAGALLWAGSAHRLRATLRAWEALVMRAAKAGPLQSAGDDYRLRAAFRSWKELAAMRTAAARHMQPTDDAPRLRFIFLVWRALAARSEQATLQAVDATSPFTHKAPRAVRQTPSAALTHRLVRALTAEDDGEALTLRVALRVWAAAAAHLAKVRLRLRCADQQCSWSIRWRAWTVWMAHSERCPLTPRRVLPNLPVVYCDGPARMQLRL